MASFRVLGGHALSGEITPQGAKNEALQVLSAVLLTKEKVTIHKIPDIRDVNNLISLLRQMGVRTQKLAEGSYAFQADNIDPHFLETEKYQQMAGALRGSIMILGPMVARFKKGLTPKPGGDKIGRRRLDTHFRALQKLGAKFTYEKLTDNYSIDASHLQGTYILLDEPSVTGTANILMASTLAKGATTIYNAACEPHIQQLCKMLNRMGAKISGTGSNLLKIEGVETLCG